VGVNSQWGSAVFTTRLQHGGRDSRASINFDFNIPVVPILRIATTIEPHVTAPVPCHWNDFSFCALGVKFILSPFKPGSVDNIVVENGFHVVDKFGVI
jgi:hypothetical protein